ncbi:biotin--[acetyl-CoA-carboxylase] ligase [Marinobacter confluentis]|uniref:Bifunctional ligase/repressor BirA n=1 Tax=Marinobacter confluentis TaxID=1697557 RepID=A0A4Z1BVF5_9GAMM|nr:biotin--[acetyl-CoA-carboxylase] ligase [Marinobacter confluentis]TGN38597.1 biotin--[acetyl-CoA-carboxylase] ligase [Marinobacter confluentis]
MKSRALLGLLADGQVHSGESLAAALGVSRTAVWKQVRRAIEDGYSIDTIKGKGYRLMTPLDLLDADAILDQLPDNLVSSISSLQVHDQLDSTNAEVIRQRALKRNSGVLVCLAEHQTAGRGRRGRQWQSPRGENLYLSLGLTFRGGFAILDGLSLALGLAVAEALDRQGAKRVGLKWPNDLFIDDCKLAGILVELQGELEEGLIEVVAGIGINVHMSQADGVEQAWTSLSRSMPDLTWQRNEIAAGVIESVLQFSEEFAANGFESFRSRWQDRDIFRGQPLATADGSLLGKGSGVDQQGNYLIDVDGEIEKVRAGEISLRASP